MLSVDPNPSHFAIAQFEQCLGENFTLITQNVDDLHERAGSKNVIHMHGELVKLRCEICNLSGSIKDRNTTCENSFPVPNVVMKSCDLISFGLEKYLEMGKIQEVVSNCEVFISIGTSGHVYPAAGLIEIAKSNSAHCIGVNLESPLNARYFDEFFKEKRRNSSSLVQKWIS